MVHTARPSDTVLRDLLQAAPTIVMVGLSPRTDRPSHEVAAYLQQQGLRVIPVNPAVAATGEPILGEHVYASVTQAAAGLAAEGLEVDIVDCFRKSEAMGPIAAEAVDVGAHCLWMQLGVSNAEAAAVAEKAGLMVVQDACLKVELRRLLGDSL